MEIVKRINELQIEVYSKEEFKNNLEELNGYMTDIIYSYEMDSSVDYQSALDDLQDKIQDLFAYDYLDDKLYIAKNLATKKIVSFALVTRENSSDLEPWHVEMIYTNKDFAGLGYGENLFVGVCENLQKNGYKYINSVISDDNYPSINLHNSFAKKHNVELFKTDLPGFRTSYEFDISKINQKTEEEEMEM